MSAILGTAAVLIRADTQGLGSDLGKAKGAMVGALASLSNPLTAALGGVAALAAGFVGLGAVVSEVAGVIRDGINDLVAYELEVAKVNATIKATGGAAGFTTDQLAIMAENLEKTTAHQAEEVLRAQAKLLTFKSVVGDTFTEAIGLSLDLADVGFGTAESSAIQLGKALENPTKGMTALARSGVTFTDEEKKKIKALQESGKLLEAQNVILAAVRGQVGGVAKELGKTDHGRMQQLINMTGPAKEELGKVFLPIMNKFMEMKLSIIRSMGAIAAAIKPWLDVAVAYVTDFVQDVVEWVQAGVENFKLLWEQAPAIMKAIVMTLLDYWLFWREALPQYIGYGIRTAFDLWLQWLEMLYNALVTTLGAIGEAFMSLPDLIADALAGGEGLNSIGVALEKAFDIAIAPVRGLFNGLNKELPDWSKALTPGTVSAWKEVSAELKTISDRKKELEGMRGSAGPLGVVGKATPPALAGGGGAAEAIKSIDWKKLAGFQAIDGLSRSIQEQMLQGDAKATAERTAKAGEGALVELKSIDKHMMTLAMESKKDKTGGGAVLGGGGTL